MVDRVTSPVFDWLSKEHVTHVGQSTFLRVGRQRKSAEGRELPGRKAEGKGVSRALALPDSEPERPSGTSPWQAPAARVTAIRPVLVSAPAKWRQ